MGHYRIGSSLDGAAETTDSVLNFAALPPAADENGFLWVAEQEQGSRWLLNYRPAGVYYSNGIEWIWQKSASQATQSEVNSGTILDKFVNPFTFLNSDKIVNSFQKNVDTTDDLTEGVKTLVPALTGNPLQFLNGAGVFSIPTGGGGSELIVIANLPPGVTDDLSEGYFIGQRWVDVNGTEQRAYMAIDLTIGAAVWKEITPVGGLETGPGGEIIFTTPIVIQSGIVYPPGKVVIIDQNWDNLVLPDIDLNTLYIFEMTGNFWVKGIVVPDDSVGHDIKIKVSGSGQCAFKNTDPAAAPSNILFLGSNKTAQLDEGGIFTYDTIHKGWQGFGFNI